jgi:tRNA dimethylallyltransferase
MCPSDSKIKIVVLCGPTAVGKTSVAIETARHFGGEIISADSMQIYRHMDIGTAKPSSKERRMIFHHLIDIVDPDEPFDAAKFAREAGKIIAHLDNEKKTAFVAGGTGLYIKALVHGLFEGKPSNPAIRSRLKLELARSGPDFLYTKLAAVDPASAQKHHPNDTHRVIRALEVFEISGKPMSAWQKDHGFSDRPYQALKIGLTMDREKLYRRIDTRVDAMIEAGLQDEVATLLEKGYPNRLKSMQSIGYRHMADHVEGRLPFDEAVRTLKRDTRRYAKRQFTWFKKDPSIIWINPDNIAVIIEQVRLFLKTGS